MLYLSNPTTATNQIFIMKSLVSVLLATSLGWWAGTQQNGRVLSVHTLNEDLVHVDVDKLTVAYENQDSVRKFKTWAELSEYVEDITAKGTIPSGYANDIQYHIDQGFLTAEVHPAIGKDGVVLSPVGKIELWYNGPNWTIDSAKDTTYVVSKFRMVDGYDAEYDEFPNKTYRMYVGYGID